MKLTLIDRLTPADVERVEGCVCLNGYHLHNYTIGKYALLDPDHQPDHTLKVCFDFVRELNREGFTGKVELVL